MSIRTVFSTITPLPPGISREVVLNFLHDHQEMIDLNPLVKERHPIAPPGHAEPDELVCVWYSLTDKISYLPGVASDVTYSCAFTDLPNGLKTHCYAPAGLNIRDRWTVGGTLPGEAAEVGPAEPDVPSAGLYIREDVDMRCNMLLTTFVKRTLKKSHAALIERLKTKAQIESSRVVPDSGALSTIGGPIQTAPALAPAPVHLMSYSSPPHAPLASNPGVPRPREDGLISAQTMQMYAQRLQPMGPSARSRTPSPQPQHHQHLHQPTPPRQPSPSYTRYTPPLQEGPPHHPMQHAQYMQHYTYLAEASQTHSSPNQGYGNSSLAPDPLRLSPRRLSGGSEQAGIYAQKQQQVYGRAEQGRGKGEDGFRGHQGNQGNQENLEMKATLSGPFVAELE